MEKIKASESIQIFASPEFKRRPDRKFFFINSQSAVRNINKSCITFRNTFKALIINDFMVSYSVRTNCEEDVAEGAVRSLRHFLNIPRPVESESKV